MYKLNNYFFLFLIFGIFGSCSIQNKMESNIGTSQLAFNVLFNGQQFNIGDTLHFKNEFVIIEKLKFYISNIKVQNRGQTWEQKDSYYLLNLEKESSLTIEMMLPADLKTGQMTIGIGIDSLTNDAGVGDKALDPLNGMYWTWNTGYINFKLEGKSSLCGNSNQTFTFHLGGFLNDNLAYQEIDFPISKNNRNYNVSLDLLEVLKSLDLEKNHTLMSEGTEAKRISKIIAQLFKD